MSQTPLWELTALLHTYKLYSVFKGSILLKGCGAERGWCRGRRRRGKGKGKGVEFPHLFNLTLTTARIHTHAHVTYVVIS